MFMKVKEVINRNPRTTLVNINRIACISPYGPPGIAAINMPQCLIRFSADPKDSIIVDHSVDDLVDMIAKASNNE